ncbi:hypothetical protein LJC27_08430 [Christensenellaceae bacterium OttesenSCG-928-M15]|nr:hypothetical protein [Christensenellaceae bacterium OttesenSCG-928-M15]
MKMDQWLNNMNRRFARHAIVNLMNYIVGGMALVFVADIVFSQQQGYSLTAVLDFDKAAILSGQVWRIITFVFVPPESGSLFAIISMYLFWLIGGSLETSWGAFRFNVFYFCGAISSMLVGLLSGYATNYYLNLSLFLAFAILYPDFELRMFFFLPIKVKYLAMLDAALLIMSLFTSDWPGRLALLISLLNILLFFGSNFIDRIKNLRRRREYRKYFK